MVHDFQAFFVILDLIFFLTYFQCSNHPVQFRTTYIKGDCAKQIGKMLKNGLTQRWAFILGVRHNQNTIVGTRFLSLLNKYQIVSSKYKLILRIENQAIRHCFKLRYLSKFKFVRIKGYSNLSNSKTEIYLCFPAVARYR